MLLASVEPKNWLDGEENKPEVQKYNGRVHNGVFESLSSVSAESQQKNEVFSEMNSRGQVDLIDMQTQQKNGYKWIMVYQQFVQIRPTKTKRAPKIAYFLIDIFLHIGSTVCAT